MIELIGLIPAAGKGTRLGLPYPKELYPIVRNNTYKPLSQFTVEAILEANVKHLVFVINETKHQFIGYYGDGSRFNCNFSYVVQENYENNNSKSSGLIQALNSSYHLIKNKTVLFGMADTLLYPKNCFNYVLDNFSNNKSDLTFGLFPIESRNLSKSAIVKINSINRVEAIYDKPDSIGDIPNLGWAFIIWSPVFTEFLHESINERPDSDFASVLNKAVDSFNLTGFQVPQGKYLDLGTYDDIMAFNSGHYSIFH